MKLFYQLSEQPSCIQHKIFSCQLSNKSKVAGKIRETVVVAVDGNGYRKKEIWTEKKLKWSWGGKLIWEGRIGMGRGDWDEKERLGWGGKIGMERDDWIGEGRLG